MISKSKIKFIRSLHRRKFREQHRCFIIEGQKLISEAVKHAPETVVSVYGTEALPFKIPDFTTFNKIKDGELQQISALKHPQKHIAVCSYLVRKDKAPNFYIALDTIQDPGNLGTILRLAAWFGVSYIVASKATTDIYNPKTVQASMGAIFNVAVNYIDLKPLLESTKLPVYGALLDGKNIYRTQKGNKGILLMGNEGKGIDPELLPHVSHPITIPRFGKGESLNVAMATGIMLSEFLRDL